MRAEVRVALNEVSASFFTDASLDAWMNEACRDVARRAENLIQIQSYAVGAGVQDLVAIADTIRVHRMEWTPTGSNQIYLVEARTAAEMDQFWGISQSVTQGNPRYWVARQSPPQLLYRLWPVPSTAGNINVHYYRLSADIATGGGNDTVAVDIAPGWEDLITDYCEYRAKRKDNDPSWKDAKDIYEEKLNNLILVTRDYRDEAGIVVSSGGAGVPSWLYGGGDW